MAAMAPSPEILLDEYLAMTHEMINPKIALRPKPAGKGCRGGSTYCNTAHGINTNDMRIETKSINRMASTTSEIY
jgi:hypothetical protein